jgi:hypothetical protein
VSKSSLVRFDHNRVAAKAARRTAQLRAYADRIVVWCDGEIVANMLAAAAAGALLLYGWARAKRLRDVLAIAVVAAIIMPGFALGYSQVSNVWRSLFRAMLGW